MDGIEQTEKYPPSFRVTLETSLSKRPPSNEQEFLNQQIQQTFQRPQTLFKDENDFRQTIDEYGKENHLNFHFLSNKKSKQNEKIFFVEKRFKVSFGKIDVVGHRWCFFSVENFNFRAF